jgi:hypothetical protein
MWLGWPTWEEPGSRPIYSIARAGPIGHGLPDLVGRARDEDP